MRLLDGQGLVVVDEAHSVADQQSKLLEAIKLLATTGRGGVSSIWITQRLPGAAQHGHLADERLPLRWVQGPKRSKSAWDRVQ
ncbi:MAG: hypothetical protein U5K70_04395 [Halodesulfurarchaeum sp.]|nr:hypothetical protein [Halodesulfurarchaeum sp.]